MQIIYRASLLDLWHNLNFILCANIDVIMCHSSKHAALQLTLATFCILNQCSVAVNLLIRLCVHCTATFGRWLGNWVNKWLSTRNGMAVLELPCTWDGGQSLYYNAQAQNSVMPVAHIRVWTSDVQQSKFRPQNVSTVQTIVNVNLLFVSNAKSHITTSSNHVTFSLALMWPMWTAWFDISHSLVVR